MTPITIALLVFACVFGGVLLGMYLRSALPQHHLDPESKEVIKLGMGLIATMAALVLGLVTASAKSTFDSLEQAIKHSAADVLLLDRLLSQYGPQTKEARGAIRAVIARRIEMTWPSDASRAEIMESPESTANVEGIDARIRLLEPQNESQRGLQSRALQIVGDLEQTRWLIFGGGGTSIPVPFLVVVVFWLAVLFGSFGLFAPRNATVISVLFLCALSVAAAIFLILEMDHPFEGLMKVSGAPLQFTLSHLGR